MTQLVPIFICAIMPIAIVLIVFLSEMNKDKMRSKVLMKAIEANGGVDAERLAEALQKPRKTARERLNGRLLRGCLFTFVGLALIIVALVSLSMGTEFSADPVTVPMIFGGASLAIGASFLVVYFVTRKEITDDNKRD